VYNTADSNALVSEADKFEIALTSPWAVKVTRDKLDGYETELCISCRNKKVGETHIQQTINWRIKYTMYG
jgi:hypothetical protein